MGMWVSDSLGYKIWVRKFSILIAFSCVYLLFVTCTCIVQLKFIIAPRGLIQISITFHIYQYCITNGSYFFILVTPTRTSWIIRIVVPQSPLLWAPSTPV